MTAPNLLRYALGGSRSAETAIPGCLRAVTAGFASTDARVPGSARRIRQDLRAEGHALIADKYTLR